MWGSVRVVNESLDFELSKLQVYIYNCRSAFQDSFVRGNSPDLESENFEEDDAPLAVVCDDESDEEDASEESEFEICPENEDDDDEVYMVSCSWMQCVLGIRDVLVWIRIHGFLPPTKGSGSNSGSDSFLQCVKDAKK